MFTILANSLMTATRTRRETPESVGAWADRYVPRAHRDEARRRAQFRVTPDEG